jgi:hypothetical protein
MGGDKP